MLFIKIITVAKRKPEKLRLARIQTLTSAILVHEDELMNAIC